MTLRSRLSTLISCAVAALLFAAPQAGAVPVELPPLPEDFSAADQYVESVPTGEGGRPAALRGGGGPAAIPLPASVQRKLPSGSELERVATSPALGAPTAKLRAKDGGSPSVPSAAVSAVDGSGFALVWLVLSLAAVSLLFVATALLRRHRRGDAGDA